MGNSLLHFDKPVVPVQNTILITVFVAFKHVVCQSHYGA